MLNVLRIFVFIVGNVRDWMKCSKCMSVFHYECLDSNKRCEEDLARMVRNVWLCDNCRTYCVDAYAMNTCSVCMGEIEAWKMYDYVKCGWGECMHFFHYGCWGEGVMHEIDMYLASGKEWLCIMCNNENTLNVSSMLKYYH